MSLRNRGDRSDGFGEVMNRRVVGKESGSVVATLVALLLLGGCSGSAPVQAPTKPTEPPPPSAEPVTISVRPSRDTLRAIGDTAHLVAVVLNQAGDTVKDVSIDWNSSDQSTVTVTPGGTIQAQNRIDSVTITAADSGSFGTATVIVEIPIDSLRLIPDTVVGTYPDFPFLFAAEAYDSAGQLVQGGVYDWRVADTTVARVSRSQAGSMSIDVTPVSQGATELVVMADSAHARATIKLSAVDDSTIDGFLVDIYKNEFGLNLTSPVKAYLLNNAWGDYWVSAAYVRDSLYHVFVAAADSFGASANGDIRGVGLWQDSVFGGKVWVAMQSLKSFGESTAPGAGRYRPAGRGRIVTVLWDHGNTNIAAVADSLWPMIQDSVAAAYRTASTTNASGGRPLLELEFLQNIVVATDSLGCYSAGGSSISCLETLVHDSTGLEPNSDYDVLAQVDLDPENPAGGGSATNGIQFIIIHWFFGKASYGDIDPQTARAIAQALYGHELGHSLGWQHAWPLSSACQLACLGPFAPARFFGWTDMDGDGVPEILDPTPYGLHQ